MPHQTTIRKNAKDRKSDIQQATLELAFEVGPDLVTTGMVADRLGLTQPALYKHYSRKEDIWNAIAENLADDINKNTKAANATDEHPIGRLRRLILSHLELIYKTPALPEIMVARDRKGAQTKMRRQIRNSMVGFKKAVIDATKEAHQNGDFRAATDADDIAALVMGLLQSQIIKLLVTRDPSVLLKDAERLLDVQLSAFRYLGENQ